MSTYTLADADAEAEAADTACPRVEVLITRHPAIADLFRLRGLAAACMRVLSHADVDDVRGRIVAGVIPLRLAREAACVVEIDLAMDPKDREGQMDLARLITIAGDTYVYTVI